MDMRRLGLNIGLAVVLLGAAACKKKVAVAPPQGPVKSVEQPPLPPGPQLTDPLRITSFTAEPTRVERGQSVTLRWATTGANDVTLDQGLGAGPANGSRQVFPASTTTYVLLARNGANTDTRSVTVEVTAPPPPRPNDTSTSSASQDTVTSLTNQLQDILFDYDMSDMRADARQALNTDADIVKKVFALDQRAVYVVEGHADERGSAEYNLGLADRRAVVVREQLIQLGVPAGRLRTISYGEEMPVCREQTEACWQRNRRGHLTLTQ